MKRGTTGGRWTMLVLLGIGSAFLFPHPLQAQGRSDDYVERFAAVSRAHALHPQSVEALYNLTQFYFDNSHPMRNLPLAMQYARLTEERHIILLQTDKINELIRLQRAGITITSIRDLMAAIASAAENTVRLRDSMSAAEIDLYLATFGDNAELVRMLRERRFRMVYGATVARGTADECYAFLTTYPGIAESDRVEARLESLVEARMAGMDNVATLDSVAARYPASAAVARAVRRHKAHLAYAEAVSGGTIADFNRFLADYPASDESERARGYIDQLLEIDLARRNTAMELAHFADSNADQPIADRAMARLRRLIYANHDAEAARYYVSHFTLDPYWSEVYGQYYSWHAVEGSGAPLRLFGQAHPDFPFPRALESDLERADEFDTIPLLEAYVETAYDRYADYVRHMMGKAIAVVPLQRMLQPLLAARRYDDARFRIEQFEICFDNQWRGQYDELLRLVTTPNAGRAVRREPCDSAEVRHPAVNPADGCLYFSDGHRIWRRPAATEASTAPVPVSIQGGDGADLLLFGFNADGSRMLLGSGGDIWIAEPSATGWRVSDIPPYPVNTDWLETDACLLPDGSGILLASDRPGGYNLQPSGAYFHGDTAAATDLWFIPYASHRWGTPVNLGIKVNTIYSERAPLISRNLKTLYFISDGNTGLGYGDIYVTERTDVTDWTSWFAPQNLGREVNSPFRETSLSFSPDEKRIYFASDAGGSSAAYSFATVHNTASTTQHYILDVSDLGRSLVRVQVADIEQQAVTQVVDWQDAEALDLTLHRDRRYALLADAGTNFVTASVVEPSQLGNYRLPAYTYEELVAMDRPLPMPVVDFSADGAVLLPVAQLQMEQLARFLKQHPQARIEFLVDVAGGEARPCYTLAMRRAEALRDFLAGYGIAAARVMLSPYGNARVGLTGPSAVQVRFRE